MAAIVQVKFVVSDQEGLAKLSNWKNQVQALGSGAGGPLAITGKGFSEFGREAERSGRLTHTFRESVHILHPVLESAGLGIGNLGAFARIANVGLVGLAAAIAGSLTFGLARLGDTAKKTGASLGTAFGAVLGPEAHQEIRKRAAELGVTSEALADAVLPLQEAQKLRGGATPLPGRQISAAATLEQLNQLNVGQPGEGLTAAGGLFRGFAEQGRAHPLQPQFLNADMLAKLPPGIAEALAGGLGAGDSAKLVAQISAGRRISLDETLKSIEGIGGGVQGRYGQITPQQQTLTGGLSQIWSRLNESLAPVGTAVSTGAFAAGRFLNAPLGGSGQPTIAQGPEGDWARKLTDTSDKLSEAEERAVEATNKFREAQDKAAESYQKQEIEQNLRGLFLGARQAATNLKYEPAETQSRLARDEQGVEGAGLNVEGAELDSGQAKLNLRKLLIQRAYQQGEDIDLDTLDALQRRQSNLNIARAGLAVRQTETNVRSAYLEQNDASLRFSKDQEQLPVSHEVQQLKYDESQLRSLEAIAQNTATIATSLGRSGAGGDQAPPPINVTLNVDGRQIAEAVIAQAVDEKLHQIVPRQSAAQ